MKTYKSYAGKLEHNALKMECDINNGVMPFATRILNVRRRRMKGRGLRQSMLSIFLVLPLLLDSIFCESELNYNDLHDPAEWTQPGDEDESDNDNPVFTTRDFSRNSPEIVKLRQNYVQALWEQILQLQKDFPSDESNSENNMPWLWQALRDKFKSGGLPNFDFDTVFPRFAGQVTPKVNTKTIMEILQDMYRQSVNPSADFYQDMERNLYLFNVYYDNRKKFLEDEAGRLLRQLYIQNKGCFKNPEQLSQHFKQSIKEAYQDYNFSPEEMHTLMFNIKHIFEGFNELKSNLEVVDVIGRKILSKFHDRLQDPQKENLYRSIVMLFNKYGPALNDPKHMEGSWPRLVVDLLAAVCQTPNDLLEFINNLGDLFDSDDNADPMTSDESDESNQIENEEIPQPEPVRAKIRRKAPQLGFEKEFKASSSSMKEMATTASKSSSQSSSDSKKHYFGPLKALQGQQENKFASKSSEESASSQMDKKHQFSTMSAKTGINPSTGVNAAHSKSSSQQSQSKMSKQSSKKSSSIAEQMTKGAGLGPGAALQQSHAKQQSSSDSASEMFHKSEKKASSSSSAIQQGLDNDVSTDAEQPSQFPSRLMNSQNSKSMNLFKIRDNPNADFGTLMGNHQDFRDQASQSAENMFKKFKSQQIGELGNFHLDNSNDNEKTQGQLTAKFMSTADVPEGHVQGFKGNSRKRNSKIDANVARQRQFAAMRLLANARAQMMRRKSSQLGFQPQVPQMNQEGPPQPPRGIASQSTAFEGQASMEEAEREKIHQRMLHRERLKAMQAQRSAETSEEDEDIEKNTRKASSKNTGEEEGYEKEYEDKNSPFGSSKGKVKAFKKSTSSESSESTSSFKKKSNKKGSKMNEKISTLDKEIEDLQEMLATREKMASNKVMVRGQDDQLSTMSAAININAQNVDTYNKYRAILEQKIKQREQLKKLMALEANNNNDNLPQKSLMSKNRLPEDSPINGIAFKSSHFPFEPQMMAGVHLQRRPRPTHARKFFPSMNARRINPAILRKLNNQGAPRLGLGPYVVPQEGSDEAESNRMTPKVMNNRFLIVNPPEYGVESIDYADQVPYRNPNLYHRSLATFRSSAGSTKGYNRKYGSESNESSSKKKIKQKNKKKKKAQKMAAARALKESSAESQSSKEKLAAKLAQNRQFENKKKGYLMLNAGGGGGTAQESMSKGAENKMAELEAYKKEVKQSQKAKALSESVASENAEEDEDSEMEIEESTSSKSAKNYGEESAYSSDLATFHSAKSGPAGKTVGYKKQFGSEDSNVKSFKKVGDIAREDELSKHTAGLTEKLLTPPPIPEIQEPSDIPAFPQSQAAYTYGIQTAPSEDINAENPDKPSIVGAAQGGGFVQKGGYQKLLPDNGQETGYQNKFGQFGTFHSAFSSPGKFGKVKGFKKKFGSETSEESSSVKKKNKNKKSKQSEKMSAINAAAASSADISASREKFQAKHAKNSAVKKKLKSKGVTPYRGAVGADEEESSAVEGEEASVMSSKDQKKLRLQQQAKLQAMQAEKTAEDDESETEIEENTSKKSAKNYGEESGYESTSDDLAHFHSTRAKKPARAYRGFNEDKVYLDDLVNFRNARQPKAPPVPPNMSPKFLNAFLNGPNMEVSEYRKKYDSESEERASKMRQQERHRTASDMAKMSTASGQVNTLNEVERSSDQNIGMNTAVDSYRGIGNSGLAQQAGIKKKYDVLATRSDKLKQKLRKTAKLYSLDAQIQRQISESEKEIEKTTHEKKEKESGDESGYLKKINIPAGMGKYPDMRGLSKGFNKNFSKEAKQKKTTFKEKSRQLTAKLMAKITEIQREIDMLSELQASRHQKISAKGNMEAFRNVLGEAAKAQHAITAEMKQIVRERKKLKLKMIQLQKQLELHQTQTQREIEQGLEESTSKDTGAESTFDNEFNSGSAADGNLVSGSSSGYSKESSSHSSHRSQHGHMTGYDQSNNAAFSTEAQTKQDELQSEMERENEMRLQQLGSIDMNSGYDSGFEQPSGMLTNSIAPSTFNDDYPGMDSNFPQFGNYFVPVADFRSIAGQRLGKRAYDKTFGYPPLPIRGPIGKPFFRPPAKMRPIEDTMTINPNFYGQSFPPLDYSNNQVANNNAYFGRSPLPSKNISADVNNFIRNQQNMFGNRMQSLGMDGYLSGYHKEMDIDGGDFATNTRENNKIIGGSQHQHGMSDRDFFSNDLNYAGSNTVSRSPTSFGVSQELSSRSESVSANTLGFSEQQISRGSNIFRG